jgi:hypothetical protein
MNSLFDYAEGFVADVYVNLGNSYSQRGQTIYGTEAKLYEERGKVVLWKEPVDHGVQTYGTRHWPKAAREAYFLGQGWTAEGRPPQPLSSPKDPEEALVERGPSHAELFLLSILESKPSRENAAEGHYAAGAAHIANMAYRQGKRMHWDWKHHKVSS